MRTEEEARYDLNEQIFELYDTGVAVSEIAGRLNTDEEYVRRVLNAAQTETA